MPILDLKLYLVKFKNISRVKAKICEKKTKNWNWKDGNCECRSVHFKLEFKKSWQPQPTREKDVEMVDHGLHKNVSENSFVDFKVHVFWEGHKNYCVLLRKTES